MILTVILIAAATLVAVALGAASRRKRKISRSKIFPESGFDISGIVKTCYEAVIKDIDAIVNTDPVESCRICRIIGADIRNIRNDIDRLPDERYRVHVAYMIESLQRILETGKAIATNPNDGIGISMKCELKTLRGSLSVILNSLGGTRNVYSDNNETLMKESANSKDFISHLIDIHEKSMNHDDFDDSSVKYRYLMLLHYMLSFHKSAIKLLKPQYSDHHKRQYEQGI